jgi:hypothetical protein
MREGRTFGDVTQAVLRNGTPRGPVPISCMREGYLAARYGP